MRRDSSENLDFSRGHPNVVDVCTLIVVKAKDETKPIGAYLFYFVTLAVLDCSSGSCCESFLGGSVFQNHGYSFVSRIDVVVRANDLF